MYSHFTREIAISQNFLLMNHKIKDIHPLSLILVIARIGLTILLEECKIADRLKRKEKAVRFFSVQGRQLIIMMAKTNNLQDFFLNQARKEGIPTVVHLVNGFQIKGIVKGFDNFTVIIDAMGKQQLIYKHAISTITPTKPFTKVQEDESETEAETAAETAEA